ncbi:MAG TPA: ferritin family protein [Armatimonadota bacterium]|nr:ferritin family protein [Armatimonadota bacterium]HQK94285.1 ferritin family protein [Armatimonadota bacterium]
MSVNTEKAISALEYALKTEVDGRKYYETIAANTKSPLVASTFRALAQDEIGHIHAINDYIATLKQAGSWKDFSLTARVSDLSGEVMTMFREAMEGETATAAAPDDTEAYRQAAGFEKKGIEFYGEQASAATDDQARAFWSFLADEERRHLALIEETMGYLDHPEDWFLIGERGLLDGG